MIQPISALSPKVTFRGRNKNPNGNPINQKVEKRLAILNAGGISTVAGALITAIARSYTSSWKHAVMFGISGAAVTMMFICPRLLYKSGINAYTKEKEFDVFTKEKEVQKKLLTNANEAIDKNFDTLGNTLENYSKSISTPPKSKLA